MLAFYSLKITVAVRVCRYGCDTILRRSLGVYFRLFLLHRINHVHIPIIE